MTRRKNLEAAHDAGKNGWPSPKVVSAHNYSAAEERQWKAGMRTRCEDQYNDFVNAA